ncbi:HAD-IIIA family hydrolase [Mesobacillus jeotgali]|uniref:HAD-IIIA family hydrolase n=1 Tax=Mesobacillus jeotgali TaxID=129985 RepID=UPI0009A641E6|nr:HAD-IIIA family hydrolase [Mesobacillus jeotgali]
MGKKILQAVFIDRDGTLGGSDQVIYPGEFTLFPGVEESIKLLKNRDVLVCSFTNQPGVSCGVATVQSFESELKSFGFDKVYLCPHRHEEGCVCRKPSIVMIKGAAEENNLDLRNCVVIGDRWTDLLAADEAGCIKILVKTGSGQQAYEKYLNKEYYGRWAEVHPDYIAEDLNEAVRWLTEE